jgi:hypothetical protein
VDEISILLLSFKIILFLWILSGSIDQASPSQSWKEGEKEFLWSTII